jgi:hypothetical protein
LVDVSSIAQKESGVNAPQYNLTIVKDWRHLHDRRAGQKENDVAQQGLKGVLQGGRCDYLVILTRLSLGINDCRGEQTVFSPTS